MIISEAIAAAEGMAASDWTGIAVVIVAIGGLIIPLTTSIVSLVGLWRLNTKVDETNVKIDGMLVDRDKSKVKEGEAKEKIAGAEKAATFVEGLKQGREMAGGPLAAASGELPVPVVDDKVAAAIEKSAVATEHVATAAKDK